MANVSVSDTKVPTSLPILPIFSSPDTQTAISIPGETNFLRAVNKDWGDGIARRQQNIIDLSSGTLASADTGGTAQPEITQFTFGGTSGSQTTTAAVAEVSQLSLTGSIAGTITGGSTTTPGNKEETDITFSGVSGTQTVTTTTTGYTITLGGTWTDTNDPPVLDALDLETSNGSTFIVPPFNDDETISSSQAAINVKSVIDGNYLGSGELLDGYTTSVSGSVVTLNKNSSSVVINSFSISTQFTPSGNATVVLADATSQTTTGTLDVVTVNFDSSNATSPVTYTVGSGSSAIEVAAQGRTAVNAAITAGTVTNITVKSGNTTLLELDSTDTGVKADITVGITSGTGSTLNATLVVQLQGSDSSTTPGGSTGTLTSYRIATDSSKHLPSILVGSFTSGESVTNALIRVRNNFVNGDLGNYGTPTVINGGTFNATSTSPGVETDLEFTITNSGTGGDLSAGVTIVTQGVDEITTGTLSESSFSLYGQNLVVTYTSGSVDTSQAIQFETALGSLTGISISRTTTVVTVTSTANQGFADAITSIVNQGTGGSFASPTISVTQSGSDGNGSNIVVRISGGGLSSTVTIDAAQSYTKTSLITAIRGALSTNGIGAFSYTAGDLLGDVEYASFDEDTYPAPTVSFENATGDITATSSIRYLGYS